MSSYRPTTKSVPLIAMCVKCDSSTEYCDSCSGTIRDPIPWTELFKAMRPSWTRGK